MQKRAPTDVVPEKGNRSARKGGDATWVGAIAG
jgi:hypothetical protein